VVKRKDNRSGPIAQLELAEYVSYMGFHEDERSEIRRHRLEQEQRSRGHPEEAGERPPARS
jgi:hypothetical protein